MSAERYTEESDIEDERSEIARSSYAGMLHDDERHSKYYEALKATMIELRISGEKQITTLDIGTGTGILSMMAAEAGSDHVFACEMFEPVSVLAREIINSNHYSDKVTVINKASDDLSFPSDLPRRANVLVSEILDSELLGEGVLPILRDAHKRLTTQHVKTIPSSAVVNVQCIESFPLWKMNKLHSVTENLKINLPNLFMECAGIASSHELQISHLYPDNLQLLSHPIRMTTLDFTKPFEHSFIQKGYSMKEELVSISSNGTLHGLLLWWDLVLHAKKNLVLSMCPSWLSGKDGYVWRDHWMQCLYYLKTPITVSSGDTVLVRMFHDDYSIWFDVSKDVRNEMTVPRPMCECALHLAWPRERFSLWNNSSYVDVWKSLECGSDFIAVFGDTSLLPIIIARDRKNDVFYCELSEWSNNRSIETISNFNDIKNITYHSKKSLFTKLYGCSTIIVDPIWSSSILPWHNLKTWSLIQTVRQQCSGMSGVKLFPCKAALKACVVSLSNLWKVEAPIVNIKGFDLSQFDSFMTNARKPKAVRDHGMFYLAAPYAMVEYDHKIVSESITLIEFDLNMKIPTDICVFKKDIPCFRTIDETCCLVSWLDFQLDQSHSLTTGLTDVWNWVNYSRQGIVFMPNEVVVRKTKILKCQVLQEPKNHDFVFRFL